MPNEKVELRAAAARLLYENNREAADYGALIEYIDNSERVIHADWQLPEYPSDAEYEECDYRPFCTHCKKTMPIPVKVSKQLGLEGLVDLMNDMPRCCSCGAIMGREMKKST
jgi:hypothetical protein